MNSNKVQSKQSRKTLQARLARPRRLSSDENVNDEIIDAESDHVIAECEATCSDVPPVPEYVQSDVNAASSTSNTSNTLTNEERQNPATLLVTQTSEPSDVGVVEIALKSEPDVVLATELLGQEAATATCESPPHLDKEPDQIAFTNNNASAPADDSHKRMELLWTICSKEKEAQLELTNLAQRMAQLKKEWDAVKTRGDEVKSYLDFLVEQRTQLIDNPNFNVEAMTGESLLADNRASTSTTISSMPNVVNSTESNDVDSMSAPRSKPSRKWRCKHCSFVASSKFEVKSHCLTAHPGMEIDAI